MSTQELIIKITGDSKMSKANLNKLRKAIEKQVNGKLICGTLDEFNGTEETSSGLWCTGESCCTINKKEAFNYWSEDYASYCCGVLEEFNDLCKKYGYYCETYDAGTFMIVEG